MGPQGSVFEGRTLDEAVRKGLETLGLARAEVMITMLEEGSGGFLGFGARPYKVRIMPRPGGAPHEPEAERDSDRRRRDRGGRGDRDRGRGRGRGEGRGGRGGETRGGRGDERRGGRGPERRDERPAAEGGERRRRDERFEGRGERREERPAMADRGDRGERGERRRRDERFEGRDRREPRSAMAAGGERGDRGPRDDRRPERGERREPRPEERREPRPALREDEGREDFVESPATAGLEPVPARGEAAGAAMRGEGGDDEGGDFRRRRRRGRRGGRGRAVQPPSQMEMAAVGEPAPGGPFEAETAAYAGGPGDAPPADEGPAEAAAYGSDAGSGSYEAEPREAGRAPAARRGERERPRPDAGRAMLSAEQLEAEARRWTEQLLSAMGFEAAVTARAEGDHVDVGIQVGDGDQLLTGPKGEVREALQHLLNRMINRGEGSRYHLQLEINDFWQQRETELERIAREMADRAVEGDDEVVSEYLNAQERRIIHQTLRDDARVKTYALGTGMIKRIAVAPANFAASAAEED